MTAHDFSSLIPAVLYFATPLVLAAMGELIVERAGVPPGTTHDLRHSFGRHLALHAPITVVQASLGHSTLAMTQRYTKIAGEVAGKHLEDFGIGVKDEAE